MDSGKHNDKEKRNGGINQKKVKYMTEKKTPGQRGADKSPRKPRADKGKKRGAYQTESDERAKSYTVSIYPSQKNTAVEMYGSLKNAVIFAIKTND